MSMASNRILPPVSQKNAFLSSANKQGKKLWILIHKETVFYLRYIVSKNILTAATVTFCIRPKCLYDWAIHLKGPFKVSPVLIISYELVQIFLALLEMEDGNLRLTQRRRPTTQRDIKNYIGLFSAFLYLTVKSKRWNLCQSHPPFLFKGSLGHNLEVPRYMVFAFCIQLRPGPPLHLTSGNTDGPLKLLSFRVHLFRAGDWLSFMCWMHCKKNPSHVIMCCIHFLQSGINSISDASVPALNTEGPKHLALRGGVSIVVGCPPKPLCHSPPQLDREE